jgi:phage-related baseplate assembly protein
MRDAQREVRERRAAVRRLQRRERSDLRRVPQRRDQVARVEAAHRMRDQVDAIELVPAMNASTCLASAAARVATLSTRRHRVAQDVEPVGARPLES